MKQKRPAQFHQVNGNDLIIPRWRLVRTFSAHESSSVAIFSITKTSNNNAISLSNTIIPYYIWIFHTFSDIIIQILKKKQYICIHTLHDFLKSHIYVHRLIKTKLQVSIEQLQYPISDISGVISANRKFFIDIDPDCCCLFNLFSGSKILCTLGKEGNRIIVLFFQGAEISNALDGSFSGSNLRYVILLLDGEINITVWFLELV